VKISAPQAIGIVVLLLVAGAISYQYGWRSRDDREEIEAIERENAEWSDAQLKKIDAMKQHARSLKTGVASCDALSELQLGTPPPCKNAKAREAILKLFSSSLDRMMAAKSAADMGTICQQILDEVDAERKRCDGK